MSNVALPLKMPNRVNRKMWLLRWMVRLYVGLEGLAAIVLVSGIAFWVGLWIDWTFEPVRELRMLLWGIALLVAFYVSVRYFFSRAFVRLPDTSLALLVERNFPELKESLVTTVEAADRSRSRPQDNQGRAGSVAPEGNWALLEQTSQEASSAMKDIRLSGIFRLRPLLWKLSLAVVLVGSIVLFAWLQSPVFGFWMDRLQLSETPWPRLVELSVAGFEERGSELVANVARDDDFELRAFASIEDEHTAPESVEIRYRLSDGRRGRHTMTRIGEALPGRDKWQAFEFQFNNVAEDVWFDLVGGDDRIRSLRLQVVERPQIIRTVVECEYPKYMQKPSRSIPFSSRVELPEGAHAVCRVESNKNLTHVTVHEPVAQVDLPVSIHSDNKREFEFDIDVATEDRVLLLTMTSEDDVENREPYRIVLSAVQDLPPEVTVRVRGISSAVTAQARMPFMGSLVDQYGVEEMWYEYQIDQDAPDRRFPSQQPQGRLEVLQFDPFDLAEADTESQQERLDLQPGQKLTLAVQARDAYDLSGKPHIGSSQRFLLDIVTESELRAQLEKRELSLRQRFESIYEKMTGIQDLLTRIQVQPLPLIDTPSRQITGSETADHEMADEDTMGQSELERIQERDRLRIRGALQNVTQIAYETLGVSEGFEDIVEELINNRVDTEELKRRLVGGIAEPLRNIGDKMLPALEARIQLLEVAYRNQQSVEESQLRTVAEGEVVLEAMKQVLDRMLELESYNEIVELLRGIVKDHEKLKELTKKERRQKLRSLLDDN